MAEEYCSSWFALPEDEFPTLPRGINDQDI
jgi:hypothetical protein